jgi:hypothetical protein
MFIIVFNILEDTRIETLGGEIYAGTGLKFQYSRRMLGKSLIPIEYDSPIWSLQGARLYRHDLIYKGHELAIQVMEDVVCTSLEGSLILTKKYCNEVLKPYIKKQEKKVDESMERFNKRENEEKMKLKMPDLLPEIAPIFRSKSTDGMTPTELHEHRENLRDEVIANGSVNSENSNRSYEYERKKTTIERQFKYKKSTKIKKVEREVRYEKQALHKQTPKNIHTEFLESERRHPEGKEYDFGKSVKQLKEEGKDDAQNMLDKIKISLTIAESKILHSILPMRKTQTLLNQRRKKAQYR